jgi:hypothetical protein
MNTASYITWLLDRTGNTVTRTELLSLINIAQNEIFAYDTYFTRTKPDPYLSTTDGVYTYTLGATIRRVSRVYALATNNNYNFNYPAYNGWDGGWYKQPKMNNRLGSPEIDVPVDSVEALSPDSASCQIIFPSQNNPGTTTDVFLLEQYKWPTQLTAESIALSIPESFATTLLYYKVLRLLEEQEYHNADYNSRKEDEWLKKWLQFANKGSKSYNIDILPRDV